MLTTLQYKLLRRIAPAEPPRNQIDGYAGTSKLRLSLGDDVIAELRGRRVIDFGCGMGDEAVELAVAGADVTGVEIQEAKLIVAREKAAAAGVSDRCRFATHATDPADAILSLDAFEHFNDPLAILRLMFDLLLPGGIVLVSFGPPWYHPYGAHLFSVFPWAHVLFSERALVRWRADIRDDGATRFSEVTGGLNGMTIGRFERLVAQTPFRVEKLDLVPVRNLAPLHTRLTREFTTAIVRARLAKPAA